MRFTTEKTEIAQTLQMSAAIAERRQTIPILSNLRIVAKDKFLEITATDLEIQLITKTEIKSAIQRSGSARMNRNVARRGVNKSTFWRQKCVQSTQKSKSRLRKLNIQILKTYL